MSCMKTKDPGAVLSYEENWATYLSLVSPADTIATSTWSADNGLAIDSDTNTTTSATVKVSGGRLWSYCNLKNTITTAGGDTDSRTIVIEIRPR